MGEVLAPEFVQDLIPGFGNCAVTCFVAGKYLLLYLGSSVKGRGRGHLPALVEAF